MPVTQADVARRAGVSQRTVSNVVNKFPQVSADVVTRVTRAIEELGYTPSHAARSLRLGRSGLLQLVVPELDVPYFAELARGVVKCAEERGFGVMVRQTLGDRDREREALEGPAAEHADGTILSAVGSVEELLAGNRGHPPVVLIGERTGMGLVDHIGIDDTAAAKEATTHLINTGRRRVAFIGADPSDSLRMAELRLRGYEEALAEAGMPLDGALVVRTRSYHRRDGEEAMSALLALEPGRRPDAVFCATDLLALGALRTARDLGVDVPARLAVVGFDGLEEAEFAAPRLSTIAPDKAEIARVAVETLLARIAASAGREPKPAQDLVIDYELIVRESSAATHPA